MLRVALRMHLKAFGRMHSESYALIPPPPVIRFASASAPNFPLCGSAMSKNSDGMRSIVGRPACVVLAFHLISIGTVTNIPFNSESRDRPFTSIVKPFFEKFVARVSSRMDDLGP